ncbi:acyl-CoA thioesterase [Corallibacter sp.]|uniref:acyl-CoA thioesterase n=1 Tax=Corallibacter sp. TaxID=2038084 RepID=UPI003AB7C7DA
MQIFETTITVTKQDLDELNHVNNVRYVQWVQDIAKTHWETQTPSIILDAYFWVMINHFITYKSEALLNDVITLKTYVTKSEGIRSTRVVEIINQKSNKLLAKSETTWCFMNRKTMRPTRITEDVINLFN